MRPSSSQAQELSRFATNPFIFLLLNSTIKVGYLTIVIPDLPKTCPTEFYPIPKT